jgi:hypothetical protein
MCVGGDLMEKALTEATQLLQKISKAAAMLRDWEARLLGKLECDSTVRTLAGIFREAAPEDMKEESIPEKLGEVYVEARTASNIDFAKSSQVNGRSISSAKSLREFEQMDWVNPSFNFY